MVTDTYYMSIVLDSFFRHEAELLIEHFIPPLNNIEKKFTKTSQKTSVNHNILKHHIFLLQNLQCDYDQQATL